MKAFIDSKRAICHKAIADGTKAEDVDWEVTMANGNKKEEV